MAQQSLNIGDTGAQLVTKFNDNCTELYDAVGFTQGALADGAVNSLVTGETTTIIASFVKYVIKRGTGYRAGSFMVLYDGTAPVMSPDVYITNGDAAVNDAAIVFDVTLDTTHITVTITLNTIGTAATLQYHIINTPIPS